MARIAVPHPAITDLVTALGLDPSKVREVTIKLSMGEIAVMTVEHYIEDVDLFKVAEVVNKYGLFCADAMVQDDKVE